MKCSEMKKNTLYQRCINIFAEDEQFYIIPAGKPGHKDGYITVADHNRIAKDCQYQLFYLDDGDSRLEGPLKYEYTFGLGEEIDDDDYFNYSIAENIIRALGSFICRLGFKTMFKSSFGKPMMISCFNHNWIIESHGDVIVLINMDLPMKYRTMFLRKDDVYDERNLLKVFIREIITVSMDNCEKMESMYNINNTLLDENWIDMFLEEMEQEEGNEGITYEECYTIIKNEIRNLFNRCLEYDFNEFYDAKKFREAFENDEIIMIEAPHLIQK